MKTKEELNALRNEVEALNAKLAELTDEEMEAVSGGTAPDLPATNLQDNAYNEMFNGCPGLTPPPGLNATTLEPAAYASVDLQQGFR